MAATVADLLSIRAYAKRRGVSHTAVQKAIQAGRISAAMVDGKIDAEKADRLWVENTDTARSKVNPESYATARAVRETYRARLAKLEYEEKTGELVSLEAVEKDAFATGAAIKTALMAVPARVAELVAAEDDPNKCRRLIAAEIRQALEALGEFVEA